jgi:hypothetical protein
MGEKTIDDRKVSGVITLFGLIEVGNYILSPIGGDGHVIDSVIVEPDDLGAFKILKGEIAVPLYEMSIIN